jgi:hypothetical protein
LFTYALRGPRDFLVVARTIIGAACVKAALGIYFVYVIMRAQGIRPAHATTHDDTVLFVTAIAICLAAYVHRPSRGHLILVMTVVPWLMLGIVANDRRIAYVSLAGSIAVIYVLLRGPVKRVITRCALLAAPLLVVYVLMGQHRNSGIFAPAAKIMSVIMQKDASSGTRDIENYNLVQTLKHGPLLGSGWGHEYLELSKGNDISEAFPQYRYIAHNSILWLWSISGVVGFTLLWMCVPITIFLATRSYDRARSPFERTAAASVIAAMVIWMVQAWGDMGTQSWPGIVMISCLLAVGAKLALATGAWPARVTVVHRPRIAFAIAARLSTSIPQAAP